MAQKPNTIIHKTFTYNVADDYLAQTNDLGKTATWTYDGPDRIWLLVDDTDLTIHSWKDDEEDGSEYPTPLHMYKVELDCNENPLLATLVGADQIRDYTEFDQYVEELPCGGTYSRPLIPPPDHTYELSEIKYNPSTGTFDEPYPWKRPHKDWAMQRDERNKLLAISDDKVHDDMPASVKKAWEDYRQSLRDMPQTYGAAHAGETPTIDAWKAQPIHPPGENFEAPRAPEPQPLNIWHRPTE